MITYKKTVEVSGRVYYMQHKIDILGPISKAMKSIAEIAIIIFE